MQNAFRCERGDVGVPRQHRVGRVEDEIKLALDGFQLRVFAGREELVGSLLASVVFFGSASRDRGDLASASVQKLQRDVTEPADADHAHPCRRRHVVLNQRVENRHAAAQKWSAFFSRQ